MYPESELWGKRGSALFKIPSETVCTEPDDARDYKAQHARNNGEDPVWGPRCPVHYGHPERQAEPPPSEAWVAWANFRELYATAEHDDPEKAEAIRAVYMRAMLNLVTEENPPVKPSPVPVKTTKIKTFYDMDNRPHHYEAEITPVPWADIITIVLAVASFIATLAVLVL